jgi:hypothetical protein
MQAFNQLAFWHMEFPERLTALRKARSLTHEELRFQFEAAARMPVKEKDAIRTMLEAMIVKNQVAGVLEGVAKASNR